MAGETSKKQKTEKKMKIIFLLATILISFDLGRIYERKKFFYVGKPMGSKKKCKTKKKKEF